MTEPLADPRASSREGAPPPTLPAKLWIGQLGHLLSPKVCLLRGLEARQAVRSAKISPVSTKNSEFML